MNSYVIQMYVDDITAMHIRGWSIISHMLNENHDYYNYIIVYVYTVFCNDFLKAQPNIKSMYVNKGGKSKGSFIFTQTPKNWAKNLEIWFSNFGVLFLVWKVLKFFLLKHLSA